MIDTDRRTVTLLALLAPFAVSAAAAKSEQPDKTPELAKGVDRDMTKVPWRGNDRAWVDASLQRLGCVVEE